MKQKTLGEIYCDLQNLPKTHPDAEIIRNWRDPTKGGSGRSKSGKAPVQFGDFTEILHRVIAARSSTPESTKTIAEVNALLDRLAAAPDLKGRKDVFLYITQHFSAMEQKWLARIILREVRVGIKVEGLLKYFHPDAEQCFSSCCDLRKTCFALTDDGLLKRTAQSVSIGYPFTPMLAAGFRGTGTKGQLQKCEAAMKGNKFVMDIKLDGERMLCHKDASAPQAERQVRFFTRKANEFTWIYGPTVRDVILTNVSVEKCILDGELLAYDSGKVHAGGLGGLLPFGNNRTVAAEELASRERGEEPVRHMFYIAFDVINLSGRGAAEALRAVAPYRSAPDGDVSAWPLELRRTLLKVRPFMAVDCGYCIFSQ